MNLKHLLNQANFLTSAAKVEHLPTDTGHEIAFAGRSNAGKSSVLNRLCARRQLAKSSKTPGRTQLINFFSLSDEIRLVDLPGYGYAKTSQSKQRQWTALLEHYFAHREALQGTILVMDARHPMQNTDQAMLDWCIYHQCDIHILLNKSDKLSRHQGKVQLQSLSKSLKTYPNARISQQLFSALNGEGMDELAEKLTAWLRLSS